MAKKPDGTTRTPPNMPSRYTPDGSENPAFFRDAEDANRQLQRDMHDEQIAQERETKRQIDAHADRLRVNGPSGAKPGHK